MREQALGYGHRSCETSYTLANSSTANIGLWANGYLNNHRHYRTSPHYGEIALARNDLKRFMDSLNVHEEWCVLAENATGESRRLYLQIAMTARDTRALAEELRRALQALPNN